AIHTAPPKLGIVYKDFQLLEGRMRTGTLTNCAVVLTLGASAAAAAGDSTRAAFLKLIDRPRVAPAPIAEDSPAPGGMVLTKFSFAAEQGERVPGLLLRQSAPGRRPVVVVLHGTGGNKEGQLPILRQLAAKGFTAIAIDGRYHGARTKAGTGSGEYSDAILHTYRTGE